MGADLSGVGRTTLLEMLATIEQENEELRKTLRTAECWRDAYLTNLTSTQERCTELLLENRALRASGLAKCGRR